eukprot:scaffold117574_cov32-Tisochrysis_lutea.AAC.3
MSGRGSARLPLGKRRVGAKFGITFWPFRDAPALLTRPTSGYIGQMMSVQSAPPHDSYCTGRDESCVRHHAAIASCVGP